MARINSTRLLTAFFFNSAMIEATVGMGFSLGVFGGGDILLEEPSGCQHPKMERDSGSVPRLFVVRWTEKAAAATLFVFRLF